MLFRSHPHNPALGRSFHPKNLLKRFFSCLDKLFRPLPDHSANATVTLRVGFEPTYDGFMYELLNLSIRHLYTDKLFLSMDIFIFFKLNMVIIFILRDS